MALTNLQKELASGSATAKLYAVEIPKAIN